MEQIINFLEEYWGYTIFGGLSLGTIITFIITQIKVLLKDKKKNEALDTALTTVDNLCVELNTREEQHRQERAQLEARIESQQNELSEKEKYFEEVQAVTFKAISYLVIASKLPTEDKIALQEQFATLAKTKATEYKEILQDEVVALQQEIENTVIPDVVQTVTDTVTTTQSLLDKYTSEG
jgi:hypothetical protein